MGWVVCVSIYLILWILISKHIFEENKVIGIWSVILWLVSTMMLIKIFLVFYGVL